MHLVLCYDVVQDRRRGRLFKKLKGFLTPVQKSVFEGELPVRRWDDLIRTVQRCIDPLTDSVRIYGLCRGCAATITHIGITPMLSDPDEPVVI
jgi:CRISPR-associated protein Cas2